MQHVSEKIHFFIQSNYMKPNRCLQNIPIWSTSSHMLFTALQLTLGEFPSLEPGHKLSFACPVLDDLLSGGLPLHGITELAGESAAGKTQFGLQLSLSVQYSREHGGLGAGKTRTLGFLCLNDTVMARLLITNYLTWNVYFKLTILMQTCRLKSKWS